MRIAVLSPVWFPVPPSGYASPIYVDGNGRAIPVNNAGNYADHLSVTDALAQSPNTAFIRSTHDG